MEPAGADSDATSGEVDPGVLGRVLAANGEPAVGAEVWLRSGGWYSTLPHEFGSAEAPDGQVLAICDAEGRFTTGEGVSAGRSLSVTVVFPGHAVDRRLRIPFPKPPLDLGDIRLQEGRRVVGKVVGADGGPVEGAAVLIAAVRGVMGLEGSFDGIGREVARTDSAGTFTVDCLTPGRWHLYFEAEGYRVEERSGSFDALRTVRLEAVRMRRGDRIEGRVTGWADRSPDATPLLVEARGEGGAAARPRRAVIQADGAFAIEGLARADDVTVRLVRRGESGSFLPSMEAAPIVTASDARNVELRLGQRLALEARVVNERGAPIERFRAFSQLGYFGGRHPIGGEGPGETREHHPDGELRASGLRLFSREAAPRLMIEAPGYHDHVSEGLKLEPGRTLRLDPVTLEAAPMLRVRVRDSAGGDIEGAAVTWDFQEGRDRTAMTGADGRAELTSERSSASTLRVERQGYARWSQTYSALPDSDRPGENIALNVVLRRACPLEAQVVPPPAPGRAASLGGHRLDAVPVGSGGAPLTQQASTVISDASGMARWTELPAGRYRVRRVPPPREPQPAQVDWTTCPEVALVPGASPPLLTFTAPACGSLTGTVTATGNALSVATLRLVPVDERNGATGDRDGWRSRCNRVTDAFGRFSFDGIPCGEYVMQIEHDEHAMIARKAVTIRDGKTRLDVDLRSASLVVRVWRDDGSPAEGLPVRLVPDDAARVGHNDGRRAWSDERGDIQQSWYQRELGLRHTDDGGAALFEGCAVDVEGEIRVDAGETWTHEPIRFRVEGERLEYEVRLRRAPPEEPGRDPGRDPDRKSEEN